MMKAAKSTGVLFFFFVFLLQLQRCYVAAQPNDGGRFAYGNENFKPSMTVTIVVLAVACVFIVFFSFYIRRCSRDVHINGGTSIRLNRTRPAPRGLEPSVIETFPTFLYSVVKGLKIGKGVLECAVCLNEFEDDESIRLLPKCDHVFHPECIDAWLSSHTTCPVCRAELVAYQAEDKDGVVTPVSESEESDIRPLNQQNQQGSSSSVPEITQVAVDVDDLKTRFPRSKSIVRGIAGRFPRSHSTGHSVVQPDNHDRFTLRLPEDVRKQILNGKLSRTMSCVTTFQRQGSAWRNDSSRRSGRSNPFAAAAAKSGRWGFLRSASFFWRSNGLARLSKKGDGGVGSASAKSDGGSQSSSTVRRPPV